LHKMAKKLIKICPKSIKQQKKNPSKYTKIP
jgi:hypothetical protein